MRRLVRFSRYSHNRPRAPPNLAAYIFLGYRGLQRRQCPISSTKVVCFEVMSSVFVTGLQGTCCCRCSSLVACPSAHQRWSAIFAERKEPAARRVCAYRPVSPGAAGRRFGWPLQCICSQSCASRSSLHLAHPGVNAGAPFERNERDRQAPGYARIVRYHQELHPGSLVAVWVLVRAKLWRIVCVWCGSEGRGRRHPRSVRSSAREGAGEHADVRSQAGTPGSLVGVWELAQPKLCISHPPPISQYTQVPQR